MRCMSIGIAAVVFVTLAPAAALWAQGTPQEPNFTATNYVSNTVFNDATGLAWAPDTTNRLFVALKSGVIRVIQNGMLLGTPFVTETNVYTGSECGLVGICFDRAFTTGRPYLYAFVTYNAPTPGIEEQMIVRYTATGNTATARTILKSGLPCAGNNHDGGAIGIGPDNKIYWAIGDLGNGTGVNLDISSLASKVGRANLDGTAPTDNPLYNGMGGARDFIWAGGFRNPFTMTFHPVTGHLWLNVVGTGWEQVFLVQRNNHGGWNTYEGGSQPAGSAAAPYGIYIDPKINYVRTAAGGGGSFGGCITGGTFYSGTAFPTSHRNNFFFGDLNSGWIMRSTLDAAHTTVTNTTIFVRDVGSIVDIETGPDGALYYVARSGGAVRKLEYTGTTPQNIIVSASTLSVNEGATNMFTVRLAAAPAANVTVNIARSSGDMDVTAAPATLTFTPTNWNTTQQVTVSAAQDADSTNDGATITASSTGLTSQNVAVTVVDDDPVNGAPTATITQPVNGAVVSGATAEFYGDGTDPQGVGTLLRAEFRIDGVLVHTDSTAGGHYHLGGGHNMWNTTTLSDGVHTLRMTVYDNGTPSLSGSHQITVTVNNSGNALVFQQATGTDGTVSIEAENFDARTNRGDSWTPVTAPAGYSGSGALQALPNDGTSYADSAANYAANSPQLDYRVNFLRTGTYTVWILGNGPTGSDDSVHVGLDGAAVASAERIDVIEGGGYVWSNQTMVPAVATLNIATAGVHVLNVWMREDGFILDKIVLTLNAGFTPTGMGPAQSARANDTDFDGMTDSAEVANGLDPAVADQNADGIPDGQNDWNGNGISNAMEVATGGAPGTPPPPGSGGSDSSSSCGATGAEVLLALGLLLLRRRGAL